MKKEPIEESPTPASPRPKKEKAQKFWIMECNIFARPPGIDFQNHGFLIRSVGRLNFGPPPGKRGFYDYPEAPLILIDRKLGRMPGDVEIYSEYWLISSEAKEVFESLDDKAFAFLKCNTRMPDGSEGPEYWFCDVLPMLDAIDEAISTVKINTGKDGSKWYGAVGNYKLSFRPEIVMGQRIFRLLYAWNQIICDEYFKAACKDLKNLRFLSLKN